MQRVEAEARLSSISSTSWDNARYRRHTASMAPPAPHSPPPPRRMQTAPMRPILKNRNMGYHFKNGSTGHLSTTTRYHPASSSAVYQHPRKSASQTSVIRTSMYGQYGSYGDHHPAASRRCSAVSLDLPSRQFQLPTAYGHHDASSSGPYGGGRHAAASSSAVSHYSSSVYSDDLGPTDAALERRYSRRSSHGDYYVDTSNEYYYHSNGNLSRRGSVLSQASTSYDPCPQKNAHPPPRPQRRVPSSTTTTAAAAATTSSKARETATRTRTRSTTTTRRPLPPEPPALPHPDLDTGWPPHGWHVYVSAMTHDYLYGSEFIQNRPALDEYVFDQDSLTFVRRDSGGETNSGGSAGGGASGHKETGEWGERGRGTQSLDLPRDRVEGSREPVEKEKDEHPQMMTEKKDIENDPSKPKKLSKSPSSKPPTNKAKQNKKKKTIDEEKEKGEKGTINDAHNNNMLSFLKSQSTISLSSKKSSSPNSGGWLWRKRTKSGAGVATDVSLLPPPVPALPLDVQSALAFMKSSQSQSGGGNGTVDEHHGGDDGSTVPPAFRDASVQEEWTVQARAYLDGVLKEDGGGGVDAETEVVGQQARLVVGAADDTQITPTTSTARHYHRQDGEPSPSSSTTSAATFNSHPRVQSSNLNSNSKEGKHKITDQETILQRNKKPKADSKFKTSPTPTTYPSPPWSTTGHHHQTYHYQRKATGSASTATLFDEEGGVVPESRAEMNVGVGSETRSESRREARTESRSESRSESKSDSRTETKARTRTGSKTTGKSKLDRGYDYDHDGGIRGVVARALLPSAYTCAQLGRGSVSLDLNHYQPSDYKQNQAQDQYQEEEEEVQEGRRHYVQKQKHYSTSSGAAMVTLTPTATTATITTTTTYNTEKSNVDLNSSSRWAMSDVSLAQASEWGGGRPNSSMSAAVHGTPNANSTTTTATHRRNHARLSVGSVVGTTSPSSSPSLTTNTTTAATTPPAQSLPASPSQQSESKMRGWRRRWTSPLSLSSRQTSVAHNVNGTGGGGIRVPRGAGRPWTAATTGTERGIIKLGEGGGQLTGPPALIWSAHSAVSGSPTKLRKKRK